MLKTYINAKRAIIGKIGGVIGNGKNSEIIIKKVTNYITGAFYNASTYGGIIGDGHNNTYGTGIYTEAQIFIE